VAHDVVTSAPTGTERTLLLPAVPTVIVGASVPLAGETLVPAIFLSSPIRAPPRSKLFAVG
jgi:hypothetical protein